jgi:hypothetical protein
VKQDKQLYALFAEEPGDRELALAVNSMITKYIGSLIA